MKKITLLSLFILSFTFCSYAQFPETFDSEIPNTWLVSDNGIGTTVSWEHNASGFAFVLWEDVTDPSIAEDWLISPQVAITTTNSLLVFDQTDINAPDFLSTLTVRVSTLASQSNQSDFVIVDTQNETDITNGTAAQFSRHSVDLSAYEGQSIFIAFVWTQDDGDALALDNIDLENQNASAPNPVSLPTPADGAMNVFVDPTDGPDADLDPDNFVVFDWDPSNTGDPATSYDIYLGLAPTSLNFLGNTPNDFVNITGMEYSTLYYWQIVAKNSGGDAVGSSTWSFTTQAAPVLSLEENQIKTFTIYPNPVKNSLTINSKEVIDGISIVNQLGQNVLEIEKEHILNNQISLESLSKGLYFMNVKYGNSIQSIKIIKE